MRNMFMLGACVPKQGGAGETPFESGSTNFQG